MNPTPKKTTVTLEDLLRVKRAERPPPEFWAEFEREMRLKQLAAIVEPRPWWAPFIRVGARFARYQVPVGAAAILALSFVTISEYRSGMVVEPALTIPESSLARVATPAPVRVEHVTPMQVAVSSEPVLSARAEPVAPAVAATADTGASSHVIPLPTTALVAAEPSPSARAIAANLEALRASDPSIVDEVFGRSRVAFEVRQPVRDPLEQLGAARDSRRARLLAAGLPASSATNEFVPVSSSDRVTRSLTEERLYDSVSRVGVSGDRVAIRF